jgi:integrase/recombinase XerD
MTDPSRVRISGPLEPFLSGFTTELARQGYTPRSLLTQLNLLSHVSRWLHARELDVGDLPERARQFLEARQDAGYKSLLTGRALRPLLAYLRTRGAIPPAPTPMPAGPLDKTLARYRHYLIAERRLNQVTARGYVDAARPFLRHYVSADGLVLDVAQLGEADVTAFMVACCAEQTPRATQRTATGLRSLLGFLHLTGAVAHSLVAAVPSVAGRRLAGLPPRLEPDHVQRLLAVCDRRTLGGRRDFAIIITLARLGLRANEVASLCLDDLRWRAGEIVVHGKGHRAERMPLPADVGGAIAAYLRQRPTRVQGRTVFVRLIAPLVPLGHGGVTSIVATAARRAGLGLIHAHRLRYFAATQLLRAGAPLSEIQQFLRHDRLQTTAIYAKVDYDALRTIARPWPGGAA